MGLALGSSDLQLAHGSGKDNKHVKRVEGYRSSSCWLDSVIVVLRVEAKDIVLTRQHSSSNCS